MMCLMCTPPLWARINLLISKKFFELFYVAGLDSVVKAVAEKLRAPGAVGPRSLRVGADRDNSLASLGEARLYHTGFPILHYKVIAARWARIQPVFIFYLAQWSTKTPTSGRSETGREARLKWTSWAGPGPPATEQLGISDPCVPDPSLDKSERASRGNGRPRQWPVVPT